MGDTRRDILDTAKKLFNQRGYNNVSTRDIAGALGISKGNLTYHFKKKEDIIEAIVAESPGTTGTKAPETLGELNEYFRDIQRTVRENAFYFWHHAQFAQISTAIEDLQKGVFGKNTKTLLRAFGIFRDAGWIRPEAYSGEYGHTVDTLWLVSIYWVPFCKLKGVKTDGRFLGQVWSVLYPLLTHKGIRIIQDLGIDTAGHKEKQPGR
ncbi:TetR/AcrR family transcriptional regulator [Breznakiella homolactica]|uniref:TetR/AcrR family transcriptional regulator n=1 Tax=Breznakiella homolactica TaxID=2798577 RepID=A0A7T7XKD5_9SPIR|nr:TetR/AcrR family transcriptional regulator [Breznakiella homolactica]QQO07853.1 TetR/AcrR family transcriptional regulator [Breznakiella homolactica]